MDSLKTDIDTNKQAYAGIISKIAPEEKKLKEAVDDFNDSLKEEIDNIKNNKSLQYKMLKEHIIDAINSIEKTQSGGSKANLQNYFARCYLLEYYYIKKHLEFLHLYRFLTYLNIYLTYAIIILYNYLYILVRNQCPPGQSIQQIKTILKNIGKLSLNQNQVTKLIQILRREKGLNADMPNPEDLSIQTAGANNINIINKFIEPLTGFFRSNIFNPNIQMNLYEQNIYKLIDFLIGLRQLYNQRNTSIKQKEKEFFNKRTMIGGTSTQLYFDKSSLHMLKSTENNGPIHPIQIIYTLQSMFNYLKDKTLAPKISVKGGSSLKEMKKFSVNEMKKYLKTLTKKSEKITIIEDSVNRKNEALKILKDVQKVINDKS